MLKRLMVVSAVMLAASIGFKNAKIEIIDAKPSTLEYKVINRF